MNPNKFLTLFMGECWHVFKKKLDYDLCKLCGYRRSASWQEQYPDHLSNPLPVIRWMEKEMPEVWEKYLALYMSNPPIYPSKREYNRFTIALNKTFDLSNLVTYLVQNPSWGEKECPCPPEFKGDVEIEQVCPYCNGSGLI
ncbi:MAG: hypothetical protein ABFD82_23595, partial [Syntrophaceae bacterium]